MSDRFDIKEQQKFVDWLKVKGLYNEFDSAQVMQKAHAVWVTQQALINKHVKFIESLRDTLTRGGEEFKEQEQHIVDQQRVITDLAELLCWIDDNDFDLRLYLKLEHLSTLDQARKLLGENNG